MASIVLAMKPKWMELILDGRKTVEFRRAMPKNLEPGDKVHLYCRGYIHGSCMVKAVHYGTSGQLASDFAHMGCIDRNEAQRYLYGGNRPGVILLAEPVRFDKALEWYGPVVQNFQYMTPVPR